MDYKDNVNTKENTTGNIENIENIVYGTLCEVYETIQYRVNKPEQLCPLVDSVIKLAGFLKDATGQS